MMSRKRRFLCEKDVAVYESATASNALVVVAVFDVLTLGMRSG